MNRSQMVQEMRDEIEAMREEILFTDNENDIEAMREEIREHEYEIWKLTREMGSKVTARRLAKQGHNVVCVTKVLGHYGIVSEAKHLEPTTQCEYEESTWMGEGSPGCVMLECRTLDRKTAWVVVPASAASALVKRRAWLTVQPTRQRYYDSTGVKLVARHLLVNGAHVELCPRLKITAVVARAPYVTRYED